MTKVKEFVANHFKASYIDQDFHNSLGKYINVIPEHLNRPKIFEEIL